MPIVGMKKKLPARIRTPLTASGTTPKAAACALPNIWTNEPAKKSNDGSHTDTEDLFDDLEVRDEIAPFQAELSLVRRKVIGVYADADRPGKNGRPGRAGHLHSRESEPAENEQGVR